MSAATLPRTQAEIVAHYENAKATDWLGFRADVLIDSLDYDHAKPYLKPEVTADAWEPVLSVDELRDRAFKYLDFAFGKAADHRGISASRSVEKLEEYAWLLGRDDVVAAMQAAGYAMYGVPKLFAFARGFDLPLPEDEDLQRMSRGEPCEPGCDWGCGR